MITVPLTPLHASPVARSGSDLDADGDHYTFRIDPAQSHVQYAIESNLGSCALGPGSHGNLEGNIELRLQSGPRALSSGQELGGRCSCRQRLAGIVQESVSDQPPLLRIGLESIVISPRSQPFELDARGQFQAAFECEISAGTLSVSLFGGRPFGVPLAGATPVDGRGHGEVWSDAEGIHVRREIAVSLYLDKPVFGLDLCLRIQGMLRGDMALPATPIRKLGLSECRSIPPLPA